MMKPLYLIIACLLISGMIFSQTSVKKVTSEVAIDGQLEESFWDISNQILINLGGCNNTANFGVLWDDNYLYVGVDVVDATLCVNRRMGWNDDGVEVYIDGNWSQGTTFDQFDRLFVKPVKSYWIQEWEEHNEGVIHQWIKTDDGYSMEFAIPWDNFNINPEAGMNIGFNVAINDDDNCTSYNNMSQLLWFGDANYYNDPSSWGTLNLSDQTVSYSGDYIALVNPNGGDFCINDKTTVIHWVSNGIDNIDIFCSTDNGSNWTSVASDLPAGSGSFAWNVSATPSDQCRIKIADAAIPSLDDISEGPFSMSAVLTPVEPLIPNFWDNYQWPYNAYYPLDPGGINGHVGNACGHSSLARILHSWEFPIVGNDELTFTDNGGFTWSANFGETTYNYDNMPNYLPPNSTEPEYTDVATLFYHAATSMHDIGGSGTNLDNMSYAMSHYFNYKESTVTERRDFNRAEWIQTVMNELDNGRVLLVQGMTLGTVGNWHETNNIAGHWYHCDGYNEVGDIHVVVGYGNEDGYYDPDSMNAFAYNLGILTGLEPDLNGKELSLQSLNGGEIINAGEETAIIWNSANVTDIRIEYTLDNGQIWEEITNSTPASSGTYTWTTPDVSADECKVKLTDVTNINVYDKSNDIFSIRPYEITMISPNGGECYVPGDLSSITWKTTPVSNIQIEYSPDNGSNWFEVVASTPSASESYVWPIPNEISSQYLLKLSDVSDLSVFDLSDDNFEVVSTNIEGGPYAVDDNTVLMLHFNGNLHEEASNYTVINHGIDKTYTASPAPDLMEAIHFDNSIQANQSYLTVPYAPELSMPNNWTVEFWFYIDDWDQSFNNWSVPIILPSIGGETNYYLEVPASLGRLIYGVHSNIGTITLFSSENSITTDTWYHVALINDYDNNTLKLILNDIDFQLLEEQSTSYPAGTIISTGTEDLRVGAGFFVENHLNGYMDELRISNVVRSYENELRANFMANIISGPVPLEIHFTDLSTEGDHAIDQWNWDFGDGATSDLQNPEHTYQDAGTFTVSLTVTDANNNSETEVKTDYITVFMLPEEPSNPYPENLATSVPLEVELGWTNGENTETVDLYFGTNNPPTNIVLNNVAVATSYDPDDLELGTEYFWRVVCRNNWGATEGPVWTFITNTGVGIPDTQSDNNLLSISPNPCSGALHLRYQIFDIRYVICDLYSISGQKIKRLLNEEKMPGEYEMEIDVSYLPKGVYFCTMKTESGVETVKMIKL